MTQLSPALDSALRSDAPLVFGAIAINLPNASISLLDGAGQLVFGNRTYRGEDATYGILSAIENLADGTGDEAPTIGISLLPSSDAAAGVLASPGMQGSPVSISLGAVNAATGQVIDTYLVFAGELDVPTLHSDEQGRRLDYEVVSVFERLFEDDESACLSDGFHQSIFPGELGLAFVTGVDQPVYWGIKGSPTSVTTITGGSYGGGGGGGFQQIQYE